MKNKFWAEVTGTIDYYFSKTNSLPLPLEFAQEVHSKYGIEKINNRKTILKEDRFLYYHDFENFNKKYHENRK